MLVAMWLYLCAIATFDCSLHVLCVSFNKHCLTNKWTIKLRSKFIDR